MPAAGLTRKQIRQIIARNLLGSEFVNSDTSASGTVRVLEDNTLRGGDQDHRGKWVLMTSGTNNGTETRVESFESTIRELTLDPELSVSSGNGDTYEMFSDLVSATTIHDAINQAVGEVLGEIYDDEESLALHADGVTSQFTLPSEINGLREVWYRRYVISRTIHNCDVVWDETTDADFTQTAQAGDKKEGAASLRLVIDTAASASDFITDNITSVDLSQCTYLEMWIKSTVALTAGQMDILLDDTAGAASALETLAIPAISANTWTYVRVALGNPALDTAIISVGFRYTSDIGAVTIFLDDIKAVVDDTAQWQLLPRHLWSINPENLELVLTEAGINQAGYHLLKLVGGSYPSRMTADTDTADIPEEYIIARATSLLLLGGSTGRNADPKDQRALAAYWAQRADNARLKFPMLVGMRRAG